MVKLELKGQKYKIGMESRVLKTNTLFLLFQVQPADKVVKRLIDQIVSQESGYQYLKMEPGV